MMKLSVILQLIVIMFFWAICFPLIALGLPYAPHLTFAALRAFIAALALLVPAFCLGRARPTSPQHWLILVGIGIGATGMGFFGMFHASEYISPGIATVVANSQLLIAVAIAPLMLDEPIKSKGLIGLIIGFIGITLIAFPAINLNSKSLELHGLFYLIFAAFGIALSNVLIRYIANQIDPLMAMGWQLLFGSIVLALTALVTEDVTAIQWDLAFVVGLFGLALPGTALVYWLWFHVLKKIKLAQANAFTFLIPIFGLLMGVAFFQETITLIAWFGILLTLVGIFLVNTSNGIVDDRLNGGKNGSRA